MIKYVIKRDGRRVEFNNQKIVAAVLKAMDVTDEGEDIVLAAKIAETISRRNDEEMSVEEIQDCVEMELMKSPRKEVAKRYIAYRNQRNLARKAKTTEIFQEIIDAQANDITRENANMNADTPAGMMMKFASEATKTYVDECLLAEDVREAVTGGYIHIHDKDYYPTKSLTCIQHPLDIVLEHGLKAGHGESRPAKRIETASVLACISMETVQNEMHGGQAIPAFDFYLAPFVRKTFQEELRKLAEYDNTDYSHLYDTPISDYLKRDLTGLSGDERVIQQCVNQTVSRVHQSMEAFVHNMNTIHSRGGNQVVFSSINYGTDTSAEGRMVIEELLKATIEGLGTRGEVPVFPIQIFKVKDGVSYSEKDYEKAMKMESIEEAMKATYEAPNFDLLLKACQTTSKALFPNFMFLDTPFNKNEKWKADDPKRYIDGVLIANKTYALPQDFIPTNPDQPVNADRSSTCLDKTLMSAWNTMLKDATAKGLNIYIASGYRSYNYQVNVYNRYVKSDGAAVADTYSSRPGNSEHQTGLCFDLNTIEDSFQYTNEGKWVNDNCYKYGFCIRFPKGKDAYTGYQYESWHLRYVGVDLATKLYNNGDWLSLEEYFGITSEYPN